MVPLGIDIANINNSFLLKKYVKNCLIDLYSWFEYQIILPLGIDTANINNNFLLKNMWKIVW